MMTWKDVSFKSIAGASARSNRWCMEIGWIRVTVERAAGTYKMMFLQYSQPAKNLSAIHEEGAKREALKAVKAECLETIGDIDQLLNENTGEKP